MNELTMRKDLEIAHKVCGSSKVEKADGEYIVTLAICQLAEIKQEEIGEYFYPELSA